MMERVPLAQNPESWRATSPLKRLTRLGLFGLLAITFGISLAQVAAQTQWTFVRDAGRAGGDILSRMVPPDLAYGGSLLVPLWDSLNMATLGTLLALVLACPIAWLAARNISPSPVIGRTMALLTIATSRSVSSLIWALILVTLVGPGVFAGILAVALRSIGFIAKLLTESIEEISEREVEAIRATGAPPSLVFIYAILPQILPNLVAVCIFRWDFNIRLSSVLGFVGAGGIGLQLNAAMQALQWSRVSTILLCILVAVLFSEWLSARLRRRMIGSTT